MELDAKIGVKRCGTGRIPYIPLWENLSVAEGVLELVVIEQDKESTDVPRIPKGKDGRAKEGMLAALVARS